MIALMGYKLIRFLGIDQNFVRKIEGAQNYWLFRINILIHDNTGLPRLWLEIICFVLSCLLKKLNISFRFILAVTEAWVFFCMLQPLCYFYSWLRISINFFIFCCNSDRVFILNIISAIFIIFKSLLKLLFHKFVWVDV